MIETIKAYDIIIKGLNENIRGLKAHPKILDKEEHKYLHPVYEKSMYIAICLSDLIIGLKYLDVSNALKNGYETSYFSRNVAHMSYELINHQEKIVGTEVAKTIKNRIGDAAFSEFKGSAKELKDVKKEYCKKLNYIRNNLFGHRTANGSEMAAAMLEIDAAEIYKIGKQIFDVYIRVIVAYVNLLSKL
ncbi:MAG: hypothetical protein NTW12_09580 [Deltaproteobacteria bacterium]|nr:hypothetical protein [Deltaproteobacteria bacterium]